MRQMISVLALVLMVQSSSVVWAGSKDQLLPDNMAFTLVMIENGKKQEFYHVLAGMHFVVRYADPHLTFRGKLKPADKGRLLLSYEIEINDPIKGKDGSRQFISSGCEDVVFLEKDKAVALSKGGKRSFTLIFSEPKKEKT